MPLDGSTGSASRARAVCLKVDAKLQGGPGALRLYTYMFGYFSPLTLLPYGTLICLARWALPW
jgi:hypothetical protein